MPFDAHADFAYSAVATAPSPATTGTSLTLTAGTGLRFPTPPFNVTIWPAGSSPLPDEAEIARVTAIVNDTLTITRAQESTSARSILVGDQIAATVTAKAFTDVESQVTSNMSAISTNAAAISTETSRAEAAEALLAPKASPTFTGTPSAPTASPLDNTTKVATTAYTDAAVAVETSRATSAEALKAPLASPALTGTPTAPTQSALDSSTKLATTAYADSAVAVEKSRAQTAEGTLIPLSQKGASSGVATLDSGGHLTSSQVPSSVANAASATSGQVPVANGSGALQWQNLRDLPDYIIVNVGGTAYAINTNTLNADYSGTTHETVFQGAINALQTAGKGGLVAFKGAFAFNTTGITLPSCIGLVGLGPLAAFGSFGSTITSTYNGNIITVEADQANSVGSFPYLANFNIVGTPASYASQVGVYVQDGGTTQLLDCYMDHVLIFHCGSHGLYVNGQNVKVWFARGYLEDNTGSGAYIAQAGAVNIMESYIHGNTNNGVIVNGSNIGNIRINDCDVSNSAPVGIYIAATTGGSVTIQGNRLTDNGSNAAPQLSLRNINWSASNDGTVNITGNTFQEDRATGSACMYFIQTSGNPLNVRGVIADNNFVGTAHTSTFGLTAATTGQNKLRIVNNSGVNDALGKIANPFATSTLGLEGTTAAPTASTTYTVTGTPVYISASGGTGVSITINDSAGNALQSGLATFAGPLQPGQQINFGAFSVAPTLTVSVI